MHCNHTTKTYLFWLNKTYPSQTYETKSSDTAQMVRSTQSQPDSGHWLLKHDAHYPPWRHWGVDTHLSAGTLSPWLAAWPRRDARSVNNFLKTSENITFGPGFIRHFARRELGMHIYAIKRIWPAWSVCRYLHDQFMVHFCILLVLILQFCLNRNNQ